MTVANRSAANRETQRSIDTTIRYTVSGPADGPTVALIHGWACNRNDYDGVTSYLPDTIRAIAIDLAEHGESRSTRDVWTIAEFARDVAAVLDAESVHKCMVVGHSLGGAVAVEVGRLLPDIVEHVITLDALHYTFLFGALDEEAADALVQPVREDFPGLVRSMVEAGSPERTAPALKDRYFEKMVAVRQPAGTRAFEGLVGWNMEEALADVKQPITEIGVREMVTQEAMAYLGNRVDFVLVDLGSHHFPSESPEGTAKLLADIMAARH
ncbi:alpha/beta fold hydrolase [Amycolatopsis vastitatis]|uniref:Alpha/beta hydrolase n=1 Tax=Amycolatopsis vastitatis TaxID=1905142 RepID=A0A229SQ68_9PSEU|nr:alpha/beta hydrolase [Amycolatopsis vastitatis]OXM60998.1 alpha/beta hydrolase [Amycolatopsis vastitatis]